MDNGQQIQRFIGPVAPKSQTSSNWKPMCRTYSYEWDSIFFAVWKAKNMPTIYSLKRFAIRSAKGRLLATYGIVNHQVRKMTDVDAEVYYADLLWNNILSELNIRAVNTPNFQNSRCKTRFGIPAG